MQSCKRMQVYNKPKSSEKQVKKVKVRNDSKLF